MSGNSVNDDRQNNLSSPAQRALAEAAQRRAAQARREQMLEKQRAGEKGGPKAMEPVRYGDWERKGRACDF